MFEAVFNECYEKHGWHSEIISGCVDMEFDGGFLVQPERLQGNILPDIVDFIGQWSSVGLG